MKLLFLRSCGPDLDWFRDFYKTVFPAGGTAAKDNYLRAKSALRQNPHIGHPLEESGLREFSIARTPFSFVYRVTPKSIEVIRVWDQRAERPAKWV